MTAEGALEARVKVEAADKEAESTLKVVEEMVETAVVKTEGSFESRRLWWE